MKKHLFLTIVILFAVVLASCAPAAAPAEEAPAVEEVVVEEVAEEAEEVVEAPTFDGEIQIGVLAPLTGPVPTYGDATVKGITMATEEWNAMGGVLGKEIKLIIEDGACDADSAVNGANKLIDQDGVNYIIGEVCSSATIPASLISEAAGVLQITPTSTNANVTLDLDGNTKEFVFRACFIDPFQGFVMAKFATDQGHKTAFVMLDQGNDYVLGLAEQFALHFASMGGEVVGTEAYTDTDTDFSAILAKVADSGAEVLYLPDYYPIVNLVGAQAKQLGVTAVMMGGDGWDSSDLDRAAAEGGYFSNHYSPDDERQIVVDWVSKYEAEHGVIPDALATLAYDAANLLFAAIAKADVDDSAAVAAAMETLEYEAVSGLVTFDEFHNPEKGAVVLHVKDGEIEFAAAIAP